MYDLCLYSVGFYILFASSVNINFDLIFLLLYFEENIDIRFVKESSKFSLSKYTFFYNMHIMRLA